MALNFHPLISIRNIRVDGTASAEKVTLKVVKLMQTHLEICKKIDAQHIHVLNLAPHR